MIPTIGRRGKKKQERSIREIEKKAERFLSNMLSSFCQNPLCYVKRWLDLNHNSRMLLKFFCKPDLKARFVGLKTSSIILNVPCQVALKIRLSDVANGLFDSETVHAQKVFQTTITCYTSVEQ